MQSITSPGCHFPPSSLPWSLKSHWIFFTENENQEETCENEVVQSAAEHRSFTKTSDHSGQCKADEVQGEVSDHDWYLESDFDGHISKIRNVFDLESTMEEQVICFYVDDFQKTESTLI